MKIKFGEKKDPENTENKDVKETETIDSDNVKEKDSTEIKEDPIKTVVETVRNIQKSVEEIKESNSGLKSRLDLFEEEKEESFNSSGDDLFNEAEKEVVEEEKIKSEPIESDKKEDGIDEAIKQDQDFRDSITEKQKKIIERQEMIEKKIDEDNLNREVNEAIKEFPSINKTDILREIENDPSKTASEIAESLDAQRIKDRAAMRDEIKKEIEEELTKEQKGNVSVPQASGSSNPNSSTQNPAEPEGDPWEEARNKAKSEITEE